LDFLPHAWLKTPEDSVVVGTHDGDLLLLSTGEFGTLLTCSPGEGHAISSITACATGFVAGGGGGSLSVFGIVDDYADGSGMFTCTMFAIM
jgi:hypothetical protein